MREQPEIPPSVAPALDRFIAHLDTELSTAPTPQVAFAISAFDAWLGPKRYHELDCDDAERFRRDERLNELCRLLRERFTVLAIRFRDFEESDIPIVYEFSSDAEYLEFVDAHDGERSGSEFFVLVIPELACVYEQHWDFTNILWFSPATDLVRLRELISQAGLHVIEFREDS